MRSIFFDPIDFLIFVEFGDVFDMDKEFKALVDRVVSGSKQVEGALA